MKTTRLAFVRGSLGLSSAALVAACSGDDEEGDGGGTGACNSAIGTNHGHELTITAADTETAADKTFDIKGTSAHSHTVELTAEDFADLADGTVLILMSSTDAGHSHEVTITC